VIYLRRAPFISGQDEIIDAAVNRAIQKQRKPERRQLFADPTFDEMKHSTISNASQIEAGSQTGDSVFGG
jgi:hypothetical protein